MGVGNRPLDFQGFIFFTGGFKYRCNFRGGSITKPFGVRPATCPGNVLLTSNEGTQSLRI